MHMHNIHMYMCMYMHMQHMRTYMYMHMYMCAAVRRF